mgnify:FL=1
MNSKTPKRIISIILILLILSCCASTSNPRISNFYDNNEPNDVSKEIIRNILAANQKKDFKIIFFSDSSNKTKKFLEGARTSFFFQKSLNNNKKEISFKKISPSSLCKEVDSLSFKIIIFSDDDLNVDESCLNNFNSSLLLVYLNSNKIYLTNNFVSLDNQNYFEELFLDRIFENDDYLFISKNIDEIEKLVTNLEKNNSYYDANAFLLIEGTNDFENEIAKVFDIKNSEKRKNNLQRLINKDLKFISRSRKDVKKVIVSSSSDIANRIIPAFKYNLLFDLEIYNLPNHYDVWKETSAPSDLEGTFGLEYPILVNKINLGSKDFFSYSPESKINYSLGFDLINFLNYGNGYFGLLGEYNYKENEVKISPINISFEEGNLVQNLN